MKIYLEVKNCHSNEVIKSGCSEGSQQDYNDLVKMICSNLNYLKFKDDNDNLVILKEDYLKNSVITIKEEK